MKKYLFTLLCATLLLCSYSILNNNSNGEKVLKAMYNRYHKKWFSNFTFDQTTQNFVNDSLVRTSTWHETIVFPNYFRISFGEPINGNAMIVNNDSVYNFNKGKLVTRTKNEDDITFIIGGMFFLPFEKTKQKMLTEGYDYTKSFETVWIGKKVTVIGANNAKDSSNQLWIDNEKLWVSKFIRYTKNGKEEAWLDAKKPFGKGFSETEVTFFINNKLFQKELYFNCKANTIVDMRLFDYNNLFTN